MNHDFEKNAAALQVVWDSTAPHDSLWPQPRAPGEPKVIPKFLAGHFDKHVFAAGTEHQ